MLICIQAGNSDNKLTQQEWSLYVKHLDDVVQAYEDARFFFAGSESYAPWQNACWVVEIPSGQFDDLTQDLTQVRKLHKQDSVCILAGEAEFI